MNRSRKDVTMMVAMVALLLFAVFNFVFKPQRSELSSARSDLRTRRAEHLRRPVGAASPVSTTTTLPRMRRQPRRRFLRTPP